MGEEDTEECCRCVGWGLFILLILGSVMWFFQEPRGGPADPDHFDACNAIYSGQPFVMPIKNVTLFQGSSARINCNVVNQGYSAYEKMFWKGPKFQAGDQMGYSSEERFTKIFRSQKGVNVSSTTSLELLACGDPKTERGMKHTSVQSFTLTIDPVEGQHEGWYACSSNFTQRTIGENGGVVDVNRSLVEKFYLRVVDGNKL